MAKFYVINFCLEIANRLDLNDEQFVKLVQFFCETLGLD